LILASFLWPADYYPHYAWFFAPFLALSVALPAPHFASASGRGRIPAVALFTVAAAAVAIVVGVRQFHQLSGLRSGDPTPLVRHDTPAGACVLADIPAVTILSDRFVSAVLGCSAMVDPIGTSYALSGGRNGVTGAGRTPAVRAVWLSAFGAAQYVWLQCSPTAQRQCLTVRRVPWTRALRMYFAEHFEPLYGDPGHANLFARKR
jgi:hypothetical protein